VVAVVSERRVAFIVGGSSGIGGATARALAAAGWHVHLLARREDRLRVLADELGGSWQVADVASPDGLTEALRVSVERQGAPAFAVYSSGVLELGRVAEQSVAEWSRVIDVNLVGAFTFSRALLPVLEPGSRLVFVSSVSARHGMAGQTAYAASKAGLTRFAEALGREVQPDGIGVHVVEPGPTATEMLEREGTAANQLDPQHVGDIVAWLATLPPEVVLRELEVRVVTSGPFARRRH
jgi:NAD(P)-dependent dehydrogenase (short-subunit alcohol dehydrogenase family)